MEMRYLADPVRFQRMTTEEVRQSFLVDTLFVPDKIVLVGVDLDRAIVGSAVPRRKSLALRETFSTGEFFCERRELGVLNIGGEGVVRVDGVAHRLTNKDIIYVGQGSKEIVFESIDRTTPAEFYLLSYPAHNAFPVAKASMAEAEAVQLGDPNACNERTIYKYIHPRGIKSCQLVMGVTVLAPSSVWNTMPPHTHRRRTEIYLYFDMPEEARVFHLLGMPSETRHVVVANKQAVISPSWSIHSGVGTSSYSFCWAMGGENQVFEDMQGVRLSDLR